MDKLLPSKLSREQLISLGVLGAFGLLFAKKYFSGGICNVTKDLTGAVVIVTGANTGIGKETARELAKLNATVIIASRDEGKSIAVVEELRRKTGNKKIEYIQLDLSDLESIRKFVNTFKSKCDRLDILINNAGVMAIPTRKVTKDGFEMQFGTNHIGHFYLTELLLDVIKKSGPSRIINLSSNGHYWGKMHWDDINLEKGYADWKAYFQSKLANVLFTKELQRRLDNEGADVRVVSVHPGGVRTELMRNANEVTSTKVMMLLLTPLWYFMSKSPLQGAQTTLHCALEEAHKLEGGAYYSDCRETRPNPLALSEENGKKLWAVTEELIASKTGTKSS